MKCDKTFQTQADAAGCAPRSNFAFADDAYFSDDKMLLLLSLSLFSCCMDIIIPEYYN